jgi:predicted nicotinamide N-methyase
MDDDDTAGRQLPFAYIHGVPIYFCQDWRTGIGGGLWSTGLALSRYFATEAARSNLETLAKGSALRDILELGSGNGFLSVCLAALASAHGIRIHNLVVTDLDDEHLSMIRDTIDANSHAMAAVDNVTVMKQSWGQFDESSDSMDTSELERSVSRGTMKFDLILGSDVAYRDFLYEPLIASMRQYSHARTTSLIGVSMTDTTPAFFHMLESAGFRFQKLADQLLEPEYRGSTFGIIVIRSTPRIGT